MLKEKNMYYESHTEAGGCYAPTSMWKVELALEFSFFGSFPLSRLARQVINVPFNV